MEQTKETDKRSLEDIFSEIESVIRELEDKDIEIEDAFVKYETGMKLLMECNEKLDTMEKKVLVLSENGEATESDEF